jgi:hypothetical protein
LVQERTNQLMEEKKKTEALLHRMLPKWVFTSFMWPFDGSLYYTILYYTI